MDSLEIIWIDDHKVSIHLDIYEGYKEPTPIKNKDAIRIECTNKKIRGG